MLELFLGAFVSLFVITDPFGNVGIFLSITEGDNQATRHRQAFKGCIAAQMMITGTLGVAVHVQDTLAHAATLKQP